MARPERQARTIDELRAPRRVRRIRAVALLVVLVLVPGAIWWQTDGQQRRRAVAGLGGLPGVAEAHTLDRDPRYVVVTMRSGATSDQVADALGRAHRVTEDDAFEVIGATVVDGAASASTDSLADATQAQRRRVARYVLALRELPVGRASVDQFGLSVSLRVRTGPPRAVPLTRSLDQVLAALTLLDRASLRVPEGLSGDQTLSITRVGAAPAELARALEPLRPLLAAGLDTEFVTGTGSDHGALVNVSVTDVSPRRVRSLLDTAAARLGTVRADGEPVITRLYADYHDDRGTTVGVTVR